MITATSSAALRRHHRCVASALNRVLSPHRRAEVRELVLAENGPRRASPHEVLSWMRVNMPLAADRVDDVLFPQPFRD
ncbi:MAG: hypothetical protein KGO96_11995 [Elusimicrobia bacterium]|nr:hypothetical protein [Elusimicrobiota bacterium]MDE2426617.1 hypothetical protein [Elusimicrobiota bacterium]